MSRIDYEYELKHITDLFPSHDERKALRRHIAHLSKEILKCEAEGQLTLVMRLTLECLTNTVELLEEIKKIRMAMNENK